MARQSPMLSVSIIEGVTVACIRRAEVRSEPDVLLLRDELFALVATTAPPNILLDFAEVTFLTSAALGALIQTAHRCRAGGGQLVLCGLSKDLWPMFHPMPYRAMHAKADYRGPLFVADQAAGLARFAAIRSGPILTTTTQRGVTVVAFAAPADVGPDWWPFGTELEAVADSADPPKVLVDFAGVRHFSSGPLGGLIRAHLVLARRGGRLAVCGLPPDFEELFSVGGTGTSDFLRMVVAADREAGLQLLSPAPPDAP